MENDFENWLKQDDIFDYYQNNPDQQKEIYDDYQNEIENVTWRNIDFVFNFVMTYPEEAKRLYPKFSELCENVAKRKSITIVMADAISKLPENFPERQVEIQKYSGSTRKKKIQKEIELINCLFEYAPLNEITNVAFEDVKEELKELLDYWNRELENIQPKPTTPKKPASKLAINQIALIYAYEGKSITRKNGDEIAIEYGHKSGHKLYQQYLIFVSKADRTASPTNYTKTTLKNKIKLFESIIAHLTEEKQKEALAEIQILQNMLKRDYE